MPSVVSKPVAILGVLMFLVGPLAAVARQSLVPLAFIAVATLAFVPAARVAWRALLSSKAIYFAVPFVVWVGVSNIWAPVLNFGPWLQMMLTLIASVLVAVGVQALDVAAAERMVRAGLWGGVALLAFLLEESVSHAAILSWARPEDLQDSAATFFSLIMGLAARGTAVLAALSLILSSAVYVVTRRWAWAGLFFWASLVACARLPMTTSAVAMVAGLIALYLVYRRPPFSFAAGLAALALMVLGSGPLSQLIPTQTVFDKAQTQLELGVQHRLGIWRHVGGLIAEQPVVGNGYNAARFFAARQEMIEGLGLPALPTHPHNALLQIWLELGAVGAVLAVVLLIGVWRGVQPVLSRPLHAGLVAGTMAAVVVISCLSFSIWSFWWIAAMGFVAALSASVLKLLPVQLSASTARRWFSK